MTAEQYKAELIEQVIGQIRQDHDAGDVTAIHEMFNQVDNQILEAFLPEGTLEEFVNRG